jgi:hypothetical protein
MAKNKKPIKTRWYYHFANGGYGSYKSPMNIEGAVEITEAEWLEHIQSRETHESTADLEKKKQIREAKAFLAKTDYIVIKIAEAETEEEKAALCAEYASVIAERKAERALVNELLGGNE